MSTDTKFRPSGKIFTKGLKNQGIKKETNGENLDEDVSTIFRDLHVSALSKAVSISPDVKCVTLGASFQSNGDIEEIENASKDRGTPSPSFIVESSTPEKKYTLNGSKHMIVRQKIENLSPIEIEKKPSIENTFSCQKLISEIDTQRRLTVDKVMRERIQNMYDTNKSIRDNLELLKQTRQEEAIARRLLLERKILDEIHEQEVLNRPKREAQLAKDNLKEAQRIQERNQRVKEAEEEAKKKSEAVLLKRKQIDKILFELQKDYNQEHKQMVETVKLCKDKAALTEFTASQSKLLKDCAAIFEGLLKKCKQGDVTEDDVTTAKKLVETLKSIHECFSKEITRINEAVEAKKKESVKTPEVVSTPPDKENDSSVSTSATPASNSDLSDCFDSRSLELYLNLKNLLENYEKSIEPLLGDVSLKKFRFNCQKAVNIPVNAISPVSGSHLSDKYFKLHSLLSGKTVEVGDVKITASHHPMGITYCKYLLAKKFVRQGDLTVSSKPDAAFPIATVLASLWIDFPDFGQLVLAHFQSACPYLAPVFLPQVEGQSDEDYHKIEGHVLVTHAESDAETFEGLLEELQRSLGYHYSQNGDVEKQDSFLKRMSGIMRLYAALLTCNVRQPGKMNPLGLSEGWRWISALLNLEPRPDICATLLYDFLEVAGNEMFRAYGGQFKKMLAYICQEYFPKLEKVTPSSAGGPMVRLEGFLQKILKEESIPPPHGVLPHNFW